MTNSITRTIRGVQSAVAALALPVGGWWIRRHRTLDETRLSKGLAIVLSGIEGIGPVNWTIARGVEDGGFPGAILLWEWTTGWWPLCLYHYLAHERTKASARRLAEFITDYRQQFPDAPVFIVAHSGGCAVTVRTLEAMEGDSKATGAVLLGAPLSARYDLCRALSRVEAAVWNFWSPFDVFFMGAGTLVFGTEDGKHRLAAGWSGFRLPARSDASTRTLYDSKLRQHRFAAPMIRQFHFGGHAGWANRVFVGESVAPLLVGAFSFEVDSRHELLLNAAS